MSEDNGPPMESLYRSHLLQASLVIPTYGHALRLCRNMPMLAQKNISSTFVWLT